MSVVVILSLLSGNSLGCREESSFDTEVVAAYERFVAAVKARDADQLYEQSPVELHEQMADLFARLKAIQERVSRDYPESSRDEALEAVGAHLTAGFSTERDLFRVLVNFDGLTSGEAVQRGLEIEEVRVEGDEATVLTRAGEAFQFVRADDGWRVTTVLSQLQSNGSLARLRGNIQIASDNMDQWERFASSTYDSSRPEGLLNIIRASVGEGRPLMVYQHLDEASRNHLIRGLEVAKGLQTALDTKYPQPQERQQYLNSRQMVWLERVADDKSLFAVLWNEGRFRSDLPLEKDTVVQRVEPLDGTRRKVVLANGDRTFEYSIVQIVGGHYRFAGLEPALQREAVRKLEAEHRLLLGNAAAPESDSH
jgi:hypothetical protein